MAKTQSTADWQTLDPTTLPAPIAKQYARYKEAYTEMKAERKAFEDAIVAQADIPAGKRLVFGYNFGKLSVAIVDDEAKPAKQGSSLSLSDWVKAQQARGSRI